MSSEMKICELDQSVKDIAKKFRFRKEKNNAAVVLKIDAAKLLIVIDEEYEDMTPDELQEELPGHQPRFVLYSYVLKHDDGRVSYPLCLIRIIPQGCKPEMAIMYSGSANLLVKETQVTKVMELRDKEDFTEEWLKEKLAFFR
ncbi:glia maturation factor beta-like [Diadema antillarum]|uniref:glia maturation factor beta-like n=1 Tax=Diadema antillarum TaxID=105358 RepID=UPI003A88D824